MFPLALFHVLDTCAFIAVGIADFVFLSLLEPDCGVEDILDNRVVLFLVVVDP